MSNTKWWSYAALTQYCPNILFPDEQRLKSRKGDTLNFVKIPGPDQMASSPNSKSVEDFLRSLNIFLTGLPFQGHAWKWNCPLSGQFCLTNKITNWLGVPGCHNLRLVLISKFSQNFVLETRMLCFSRHSRQKCRKSRFLEQNFTGF